jgi:signal transduction histidine kinase
MEKVYRQLSDPAYVSDGVPLASPPSSRWGDDWGEEVAEVVEVRPPMEVVRQPQTGHEAADRELFPVVSAAHECKTPLVVMLGYADLLRSGRFGPLNEKQRQMLDEIQESGERLRKFTHDLMLLYQLQSPEGTSVDSREEAADLNEALRGMFNYWAPAATSKSIAYHFCPAPGNPRVIADPLKLQHIVSNVVENALKYTPPNGEVVVRATPCFWERRKAQAELLFNFRRRVNRKIANAVHICVSDNGPGIPQEHHEDIFRDFVRLPDASSRGTGLGLAIARRLTLAHGGAIWVESEPGRGSRFSLLFVQMR